MDRHTIYNAVSGMIGIALAGVFFLILFGRIDIVGLAEGHGLGDATGFLGTPSLSAADAKAQVIELLEASPRALEPKLDAAVADLGVAAITPSDLYIHSTFRYDGGRCVRIGIIDDDTTMQAGRIYLFVDDDGIVHAENDC